MSYNSVSIHNDIIQLIIVQIFRQRYRRSYDQTSTWGANSSSSICAPTTSINPSWQQVTINMVLLVYGVQLNHNQASCESSCSFEADSLIGAIFEDGTVYKKLDNGNYLVKQKENYKSVLYLDLQTSPRPRICLNCPLRLSNRTEEATSTTENFRCAIINGVMSLCMLTEL